MRSRSPYPHPTILGLALLSACPNGPEATGDPTSDLAGTPPPAAAPPPPVATVPPTPTASVPPATPPMLAGVTSPSATPENTAEFRELIAADWELAPGTEHVVCVRQTFTKTTFVSGWRGDVPFGTHHLLLTMWEETDGEPDGQFECDATTLAPQNVFAAGVGSRDIRPPPEVAVKLAQGAQALFNVHLFNPTDKPLRGRSAVRAQTLDEKDVREISDNLLATTTKLDVPPGRSMSRARCTFDRDATIFGIGPHMHQMGVAMRVIAHTAVYGACSTCCVIWPSIPDV